MGKDVDAIHHIGIVSRDMAAAVRQYERLGFIFTPISIPKIPLTPGGPLEPLGVANRCAIFENSFLEMLGVIDAARWAAITPAQRGPFDIDRPLARYEGLHVLHFGADDLDAVRARLVTQGLQPSEIRPFQRLVDTPDGPQMMRARAMSFPPAANPEALMQMAQHETRELALPQHFMHHPNGAIRLSEAIVCVPDPDRVAAKYQAYTACPVRRSGALRVVGLGQARVVVVDPDHLGDVLPGAVPPTVPFLAGFTVTADLAIAERALEQQGVQFRRHGKRILIDARDAAGCAVLFERPDAAR